MSILNEAALVPGPTGVYQATVSSAVVFEVPAGLRGCYVKLSTHDASIQYHFAKSGTGAVVAEDQATTTTGTGTSGDPFVFGDPHVNTGERLADGMSEHFVIGPDWTHFGVIAEDSGTAEITLRKAAGL